MNEKDLILLKSLVNIPSPSGFEENIAKFIYDEASQIVGSENVKIDKYKNVVVTLDGEDNSKTVMIDAHADEIAFIVVNVNRYGKISMQYIGGGDSTILTARHLNILTSKGILPAVIDRKHSHLVYDEDAELNYSPEQADVDVGFRNREDILKYVQIGDPIVYESNFRELGNGFYTGYGFDDKSGCFLLLKVLQSIVNKKRPVRTVFTFSAQEETGSSKVVPLIKELNPNLFIETDVTFGTDYGIEDEYEEEVGRCILGAGVVLYRGVDIDKESWKLLSSIAEKKKIPYQVQASTGKNCGYIPLDFSVYSGHAKSIVVGIPLRNMHTPCEIINENDLLSGAKLLTGFLLSKKLKDIL